MRLVCLTSLLLVAVACGSSPTGPGGRGIQSHLDSTTPDIKVNGVNVQAGSTANVSVGSRVDFRVDFTNNSGQVLHTALVLVREDGVERLLSCGASGSGGQGGAFGVGTTIFTDDRGHTLRVLLLGAYGPNVSGPGQCFLQSASGQVNHANVQAERFLATLAVQ